MEYTAKTLKRMKAFLRDNWIPKKIRVYDNTGTKEESIDNLTVVFTGNYTKNTGGEHLVLALNNAPFYPQGFCQHCSYKYIIDYPAYGHLGKKIKFLDLNKDCQRAILQDYTSLWDLPITDEMEVRYPGLRNYVRWDNNIPLKEGEKRDFLKHSYFRNVWQANFRVDVVIAKSTLNGWNVCWEETENGELVAVKSVHHNSLQQAKQFALAYQFPK